MEVAGIVLSAIPICVAVLESWNTAGERISAFRRWRIKTTRFKRLLQGHQHDLEILLKMMLHGTIPDSELSSSRLWTLLHEDWQDDRHAEMVSELHAKHGGELYESFQVLMQDICDELKVIITRMGIASERRTLSNRDFAHLLRQAQPQNMQAPNFLDKVVFAVRYDRIEKSLNTLATHISMLQHRMNMNLELQKGLRRAGRKRHSAQSKRFRAHLEALHQCLERTTRAERSSQSLAIALQLSTPSSLSTAEHSASNHIPARYSMALSNRIAWQRTVFHVSDTQRRHILQADPAVVKDVTTLWPMLEPSPMIIPCLEMHLDLGAQNRLSGPYETVHGKNFGMSDCKPELISLAATIGKGLSLSRRLEFAAVVTSSVTALYDTPFLDDGNHEFSVLVSNGQAAASLPEDCRIYLKKELAALQPVANMAVQKNQQAVLLMLGVVLLELILDQPCPSSWSRNDPLNEDLKRSLETWYAQVWPKLPRRYWRAVRCCLLVGSASVSIANNADQDLDAIAEDIATVYNGDTT